MSSEKCFSQFFRWKISDKGTSMRKFWCAPLTICRCPSCCVLEQGSVNQMVLLGKTWTAACFTKFYWNIVMTMCVLWTVHACFCATTVESTCRNVDYQAHKAWNIYRLILYGQSLLIVALDNLMNNFISDFLSYPISLSWEVKMKDIKYIKM